MRRAAWGLRFRRSLRLLPGLRLNLTKSGSSVSLGEPGASLNLGHDGGKRVTVGLPGTGLSYRETIRRGRRQRHAGIGAMLLGAAVFAGAVYLLLRAL